MRVFQSFAEQKWQRIHVCHSNCMKMNPFVELTGDQEERNKMDKERPEK